MKNKASIGERLVGLVMFLAIIAAIIVIVFNPNSWTLAAIIALILAAPLGVILGLLIGFFIVYMAYGFPYWMIKGYWPFD